MTIQSWRAGAVTWIAWVVAGGLGAGLATLLALAGMGSWLDNNADELRTLAYEVAFIAIATVFQYVLLLFVARGRRALVLWLPATMLALIVYGYLDGWWFTSGLDLYNAWLRPIFPSLDVNTFLDASVVTYPLALGLVQGILLVLATRRKAALAWWLAGNVAGLIASFYVPSLVSRAPEVPGQVLILSSALEGASYAIATGLALVLILRARSAAAPSPPPVLEPVAALQGQG